MKVLIFGPSGAGKTYLSKELQNLGLHTVDADTIDDLRSWYNGNGEKVAYPEDADATFLDNHLFLWDKTFLAKYLQKYDHIYMLGASGNVLEALHLFDKVFYLDVPSDVMNERLQHPSRENLMGKTEYQRNNAIAWGKELRQQAKELKIPFIDATLSPEEIFTILQSG